MKANKPESINKTSKKAEKKALEQSLTAKLFEAVKSLGHDAEKIGEDLILVSKFVAKKISKRVKSQKQEAVKAGKKQVKKVTVPIVSDTDPVDNATTKPKSPRAPKKSEAVLKKVAAKPKATVSSVKVNTDPFVEEFAADVEEVKPITPAVKTAKVSKPASKKTKPASGDDKGHIN